LGKAIYHAYWVEGRDLSTAQAVSDIALPASIDAAWLREGIESDEARVLLRGAVDTSLKAGIFGSPTVVVDGEPFWGVGTFDLLDEWLTKGGW
jgi:2-hydroxychromene-2-carboxylate isomerase